MNMISIFIQHICILKVFLVTGGITIYKRNPGIQIRSTEVYNHKDRAWSFVGELPWILWAVSATTLDNKVLLFGKPSK